MITMIYNFYFILSKPNKSMFLIWIYKITIKYSLRFMNFDKYLDMNLIAIVSHVPLEKLHCCIAYVLYWILGSYFCIIGNYISY